jgi:predicted transglutaminase-like cysteine proteinase
VVALSLISIRGYDGAALKLNLLQPVHWTALFDHKPPPPEPIMTFRVTFRATVALIVACVWLIQQAAGINFDLVQQTAVKRFGAQAGAAIRDWQQALEDVRKSSEREKLQFINAYFNGRVRWVDDQTTWGVQDYWATPLESLGRSQGDCEDYVIAKYFSLKYLGVPVAKLRLTYAKLRMGGPASTITQAHMVLAYYSSPDAEPLILDNLISEMRPASRRADLAPVFSFNTEGVWMTGGQPPPAGGSSGLTRWQDLLTRMNTEGFDV